MCHWDTVDGSPRWGEDDLADEAGRIKPAGLGRQCAEMERNLQSPQMTPLIHFSGDECHIDGARRVVKEMREQRQPVAGNKRKIKSRGCICCRAGLSPCIYASVLVCSRLPAILNRTFWLGCTSLTLMVERGSVHSCIGKTSSRIKRPESCLKSVSNFFSVPGSCFGCICKMSSELSVARWMPPELSWELQSEAQMVSLH